MSKPFEREARYVVLKGTDIAQFLTENEQHRLKNLMATVAQWRVKSGKAPLDVFVIEQDWPEFDIAVEMVRRRMEGEPTREAAAEANFRKAIKVIRHHKQAVDALMKENAELTADRDKWQGKAHALNQEMITLTANISRLRRALAPYAQESEWKHATGADHWRLLFNSTDRDGHGYERAQAALLLTEPKEAITAVSPMSTAPRDGTEILAYHIDGKNYHPVFSHGGHWGMRWNDEYYCGDGCYSGWIPYPKRGD